MSIIVSAVLWVALLAHVALVQSNPAGAPQMLGSTDRLTLAWRDWPVSDGPVRRAVRAIATSSAAQNDSLRSGVELIELLDQTSGVLSFRPAEQAANTPDAPPIAICAIECGDARKAEAVSAALGALLRSLNPATPVRERNEAANEIASVTLGQTSIEISWASRSNWVLAATASRALAEVLNAHAMPGFELHGSAAAHLKSALPTAPGFGCFVDIGFVADLLTHILDTAMPREQVAEICGVFRRLSGSLPAVAARVEFPASQPARTHVALTLPNDSILLRAARGARPITAADVCGVPVDAYWVQVWRLDLNAAVQAALESLDASSPDTRSTLLVLDASAGLALGFSPLNQLLPAVGETWTIYDAPANGGLLGFGTVAVIRLRDENAIGAMLPRIVEVLTPLASARGVSLALLQRTFETRELSTVILGGMLSPLAPSWTFVDGHLVIGMLPDSVLAAASQLDAKTRGPSLVDRPDFAARFAELGERPITFAFTNSREWRRTSGPVRTHYLTALLSKYSSTSQLIELASATSLARRLASSTDRYAAWRVDASDQLYRGPLSYLSIGDCDGFVDFALAGTWLTTVAIPLLDSSTAKSQDAAAQLELRRIADAIARHAAANDGQFPTEITRNADRATYVPGQSWADDDRNVLAYVVSNDGKYAATLLLSGKIKSLSLDELNRELAATAKRLAQRPKSK